MKCPLCEHEPRGGNQPNYFTVTADEQQWKCHVHDGGGNAHQLLRLLTQGHDITAPVLPTDSSRNKDGKPIPWQGATISQLAQAKGLDPDFLKDSRGWIDTRYYRTPAVQILYPDEDNGNHLTRYRVGITGDGERFRWAQFKNGQRMRLYGLWNLAQIRERGYVILVEGETDAASLMYSGLPVLGNPGNSWNESWNHHLDGVKV